MEATAREHPRRTETRLALGAAGVTVLLWSSAFVALRAAGRALPRPADARPAERRSDRARWAAARSRGGPAAALGVAARRALRPALVRHLQRLAGGGRAARRRRNRGDAREHRTDPDRPA